MSENSINEVGLDGSWKIHALCRGIDAHTADLMFFPVSALYPMKGRMKRLCAQCPVSKKCLEWGNASHSSGSWGGYTEPERRAMRGRANGTARRIMWENERLRS
jgi:hypothetical protein